MEKKTYYVLVPEIHVSVREVQASSEAEALELADDFDTEINLEYSHTLDRDQWTVEGQE